MLRRTAMVLFVAAAMSSCGGDDEGDGGGAGNGDGGAMSQQEYAAKADAICAAANEKEAALGAPGPGWTGQPQFDDVKFLEDFNAAGRAAVKELQALTPPEAQAENADAVVTAIEDMVKALDARIADLKKDAKADPSPHVRAYLTAYTDLTPAAGSLGLSQCQGVSL